MSTASDPRTPSGAPRARVPRLGRGDNPEARMPLMEHIRELRSRLLKALLGLGLGMGAGWILYHPIWAFLERPYCNLVIHGKTQCTGAFGHTLVFTSIYDAFFVQLKVSFLVGLIASSPVWLYQLWSFVAPGLYAREKRWTYFFVGLAAPLFGM